MSKRRLVRCLGFVMAALSASAEEAGPWLAAYAHTGHCFDYAAPIEAREII